jgi:hypothetical protein
VSGEARAGEGGALADGVLPEGALPEGVLVARVGAGANCSSAGSAIDILFYTSVIAGAIAVALAAAYPPRDRAPEGPPQGGDGGGPAKEGGEPAHETR